MRQFVHWIGVNPQEMLVFSRFSQEAGFAHNDASGQSGHAALAANLELNLLWRKI